MTDRREVLSGTQAIPDWIKGIAGPPGPPGPPVCQVHQFRPINLYQYRAVRNCHYFFQCLYINVRANVE